MAGKATLQIEYMEIDKLIPYINNARTHSDQQIDLIAGSIKEFGFKNPIIIDKYLSVIAGHGRLLAAKKAGLKEIPAISADDLTPAQVKAYRLADNRLAEVGTEWDYELLNIEIEELQDLDFDIDLTGFDESFLVDDDSEGLTDADAVPEVNTESEPVTTLGMVWLCGNHRVMCGDSTNDNDIRRLMNGERALLVHADPPYGMGKEGEGVINDNKYGENLDKFQMEWWANLRPHVEDNGSAYIWGNVENLWRLWYLGGLKDSERFTFRNEIAWHKGQNGFGVGTEAYRMYQPTERCLVFMLGEQDFNNNTDNYWEGWESIRAALWVDCESMGWGPSDIKRICGVGMYSHWFTRSQWTFIPKEHYIKLQNAAKKYDGFKRDYDDLKREFYDTRAYFDNTHDSMTDVWDFTRVTGEERLGHATPKPAAMMERVMRSSLPEDALCVEPFGGSGSTLMGAERADRKCYTMELDSKYCDVIVNRWQDYTGKSATLENDGRLFDEIANGQSEERAA